MEQRSPEWFTIRRGKITASEVGMFVVTATTQKAKDARQSLIDKKLGEIADGDDTEPSYENYWMRRGSELEPESMHHYEAQSGENIRHVGFIEHEELSIGCSPDGLHICPLEGTDKKSGVEGKVTQGKTQIVRLREGILPPEYVCQIHHSLVVTGADYWDFWSYHPALPRFLIRTYRNDFTERFEQGLREICGQLAAEKVWIKNLWEANRTSIVPAKEGDEP